MFRKIEKAYIIDKASSSDVLSTCLLIVTGSVGAVGGNLSAVGYTASEETPGNGHVPKHNAWVFWVFFSFSNMFVKLLTDVLLFCYFYRCTRVCI